MWLAWLLHATALIPLARAWVGSRRTSLAHAVSWAILGWLAWAASLAARQPEGTYIALALTGCAGIAVFGARRPGVAAWDFIVTSLLLVLVLPLAEGTLTGTPLQLGTFRAAFLIVLLGTTVANYLPTRLGVGAVALAIGAALELRAVWRGEPDELPIGVWLVSVAPWLAWGGLRLAGQPRTAFDRRWAEFRDRWGTIWAQRLREQFNRAAANAGWDVELRWRGLDSRGGPGADLAQPMEQTLLALMKRFGTQ